MGGVDLESNNLASWDIFHTTIPKTDRFFSLFYDREMGAMNYSSFMYASFGHYNFKKKRQNWIRDTQRYMFCKYIIELSWFTLIPAKDRAVWKYTTP